jgi:hypothetical protein
MPLDDGTELARLLRKHHRQLVDQAVTAAADAIGYEFDLEAVHVQEVLDLLAKKVVRIAEHTRERIRELVGQAAQEGWSPDDLAARIEQSGLFSPERARNIALTESNAAYSRGSLLYYRESGVVAGVEWLVGPKPCEEVCAPLAGKVVPLGEEFAPGIEHPPAHPGECHCALAPVLRDA